MSALTLDLKFNGYWREPKISGLPAESGVFCVYLCSYNAADKAVIILRLLHIGETGNANRTVAQHPLWSTWKAAKDRSDQQICFTFAPVAAIHRHQIAAALIYAHKPITNGDFKNDFPFEATVLTINGRSSLLQKTVSVVRIG